MQIQIHAERSTILHRKFSKTVTRVSPRTKQSSDSAVGGGRKKI